MSAWIEDPDPLWKDRDMAAPCLFCVDMAVSGLALIRSSEREKESGDIVLAAGDG